MREFPFVIEQTDAVQRTVANAIKAATDFKNRTIDVLGRTDKKVLSLWWDEVDGEVKRMPGVDLTAADGLDLSTLVDTVGSPGVSFDRGVLVEAGSSAEIIEAASLPPRKAKGYLGKAMPFCNILLDVIDHPTDAGANWWCGFARTAGECGCGLIYDGGSSQYRALTQAASLDTQAYAFNPETVEGVRLTGAYASTVAYSYLHYSGTERALYLTGLSPSGVDALQKIVVEPATTPISLRLKGFL